MNAEQELLAGPAPDGINDHVVTGAATVRPAGKPEKADTAGAGRTAAGDPLGDDFIQINRLRQVEAEYPAGSGHQRTRPAWAPTSA